MIAQGLPEGYRNPALSLELIIGAEDGRALEFVKKECVQRFRLHTYICDLFHLLEPAAFSNGLFRDPISRVAGSGCAVAAVLDLIEDREMLKAMAGGASDSLANSIRYPPLAKWALLFLFSLLVGCWRRAASFGTS